MEIEIFKYQFDICFNKIDRFFIVKFDQTLLFAVTLTSLTNFHWDGEIDAGLAEIRFIYVYAFDERKFSSGSNTSKIRSLS